MTRSNDTTTDNISWILVIASIAALGGCATTKNLAFRDDRGRRCFAPCQTSHEVCIAQCALHQHHAHDVAGSLLDLAGNLACFGHCNSALESCGVSCGGRAGGGGGGGGGPVASDARHQELRVKLLQQDGLYAPMQRDCSALYKEVNARAMQVLGKPREGCSSRATFMERCLALKPGVASCLRPDAAERDTPACQAALQREELVPASNMNAVLGSCYPPKGATSQLVSRPQPQPAQSAPTTRQLMDAETPQ